MRKPADTTKRDGRRGAGRAHASSCLRLAAGGVGAEASSAPRSEHTSTRRQRTQSNTDAHTPTHKLTDTQIQTYTHMLTYNLYLLTGGATVAQLTRSWRSLALKES